MLKKLFISFALVIVLIGAGVFWLVSLMDPPELKAGIEQTQAEQLAYLQSSVPEKRGRILAVVSSASHFPDSEKYAGYELTELARAYWVFSVNGYEVDIASPKGGHAPANIDYEDMGPYDYAFLNSTDIQLKLQNTLALSEVRDSQYDALYFVGGKGAMFDFPNNPDIQALTRRHWQQGLPIAAICHGPAALSAVTLDNGQALIKNKRLTSFTNEEELFLIPDAAEVFPFMLESELSAQGAEFVAGNQYLGNVVIDGALVSGQNPWSVWPMAEALIRVLGHTPVERELTTEEHSINVLNTLAEDGIEKSKAHLIAIYSKPNQAVRRDLFAIHAFVSVIKGELSLASRQIRLMSLAKALSNKAKSNRRD